MNQITSTLLKVAAVLLTVALVLLLTGCATINTMDSILEDKELEQTLHFTNFMMMPLN